MNADFAISFPALLSHIAPLEPKTVDAADLQQLDPAYTGTGREHVVLAAEFVKRATDLKIDLAAVVPPEALEDYRKLRQQRLDEAAADRRRQLTEAATERQRQLDDAAKQRDQAHELAVEDKKIEQERERSEQERERTDQQREKTKNFLELGPQLMQFLCASRRSRVPLTLAHACATLEDKLLNEPDHFKPVFQSFATNPANTPEELEFYDGMSNAVTLFRHTAPPTMTAAEKAKLESDERVAKDKILSEERIAKEKMQSDERITKEKMQSDERIARDNNETKLRHALIQNTKDCKSASVLLALANLPVPVGLDIEAASQSAPPSAPPKAAAASRKRPAKPLVAPVAKAAHLVSTEFEDDMKVLKRWAGGVLPVSNGATVGEMLVIRDTAQLSLPDCLNILQQTVREDRALSLVSHAPQKMGWWEGVFASIDDMSMLPVKIGFEKTDHAKALFDL